MKPKFKLDDEVYFFTNISKVVEKGKIIGIWILKDKDLSIYNYQIEHAVGDKKDQIAVVEEESVTKSEKEMQSKFIPYVKRALANKIKLTKDEIKDIDKKIGFINEEKTEAIKYLTELENKLKEYNKGNTEVVK